MNNQTEITCVATDVNDIFSACESQRVRVTFFGPPSKLLATENEVGSLRISWSSFSIEGVTVEFTLTAINLNTSNITIVRGIQEQHYIFTVEDSSSCDVYIFQVTAPNDAGSSGLSEILTRSLPSLPDISAVGDSLKQSLVKTADGVTLSVMFQGITSCPEYPVTSYTLVLVDSEGNETRESSAVTSGEITLVVDGLMEGSLYSYYIAAANMIGDISTKIFSIITTDVQGASFCLVEGITYSIQCSYITGSDARGCVYTLVSAVEGVANITGTIDRSSSEGVQIGLPNISDFVELLVSDWHGGNSTHIKFIKVNATLMLCKSTEAAPPVPTAIIIITSVTLVCIVTIITVITIIIFCSKRHHENNSSRKKGVNNKSVTEVCADNRHRVHELSEVHCLEAQGHDQSSFTESVENEYYSPHYAQVGTVGAPKMPRKSRALKNYLQTVPIRH